jgi:hypothetical protein
MIDLYNIFLGIVICFVLSLFYMFGVLVTNSHTIDSCNLTNIVIIQNNVYECKLRK